MYVSKTLTIEQYNTVREKRTTLPITQNMISTRKHQIYSQRQLKVALSSNDDKVFINDNNISTYNFNHWRIRKDLS